jgi:gliding motility-associated-like protein
MLQNQYGCDSLILTNTNFVPLQLNFELDSITCFNLDNGHFKIVNSSDFSKPLELFLNDHSLGDQNQITNLGPGTYRIYVKDQKGCITDSVEFTFTNPDELIIDLGNDLEVKKGSRVTLNLQSNKQLNSITWIPSNLSNCKNCPELEFNANHEHWIYAQVIDIRGCTQSDSLFIRLKKKENVYAPNTFTPNGDNINDYFYIIGNETSTVETMLIYDRWGNLVFEIHDLPVNQPTKGWDGSFQSQKMNPGVFVFYAKVRLSDDELVELKGDVTLIR